MHIQRFFILTLIFFFILILESWWPFFQERKRRWIHGRNNLILYIINSLFLVLVAASLTGFVFLYSDQQRLGLFYYFTLPGWLRVISVLILFDFWMYIWHRMNHEIPFLWRFHRVHHSDPALDVTSALRFHIGEIFFSSIIRLGIILLLGMRFQDLILYESVMLPVIFLHHSNFNLPEAIDKWLRLVIVTPRVHWVHHSNLQPETDSNYGTILSWWDRLWKTFRLRENPRSIQFGLKEFTDPYWQSVPGMLKTPLLNIVPVIDENSQQRETELSESER